MEKLLYGESDSDNIFDAKLNEGIDVLISKLREKGIEHDVDLPMALKRAGLMTCIPLLKEFNPRDKSHRIQDQVGYGFPFTSTKHPWPLDSEGRPKQPVIQIDLENAAHKLHTDFCGGLLQIWISAYTETEDPDLELRHIEAEDLGDSFLEDYPSPVPWLKADGSFDSSTRFNCDFISSPLIEWKQIGYILPDDPELIANNAHFQSIANLLQNPDAAAIYFDCLGFINEEFESYVDSNGGPMLLLLGGRTVNWGDNHLYYHEIDRPDKVPGNSSEPRLLFHVKYDNGIGSAGIYVMAGDDDVYCDAYERLNM